MRIVTNAERKRKHADVGYSLYVHHQPITACQNEDQRAGWRSAYTGHMACMTVDAVFAAGGNATDADHALQEGAMIDYEAELELLRDGMDEESWLRSWH
jgi:hypothetical protein